LRRDGRGQNVAATPESLKHIGVAPLRGFLEGGWKFFWVEFQKLGLNKISRISDSVLAC
jgi:hypothetical protein